MLPIERRNEILTKLTLEGKVIVGDLAQFYNVTEETINRGIDISGEYDIDFNLLCPNCCAIVGTFEAEEDEYYFKYCPTCGQALDWSDTE